MEKIKDKYEPFVLVLIIGIFVILELTHISKVNNYCKEHKEINQCKTIEENK